MKVLDLRCAHDHRFEGWFASDDDYASQRERGLVQCPLCGDGQVERLPSAPRLNLSAARQEPQQQQQVTNAPDLQALWMRAVQHVLKNTEDVGERFAEEARRIHYGEVEQRGIRGKASREDTQALLEEGIEVAPLPIPPGLDGPVQ
jgi:hypothetical protein